MPNAPTRRLASLNRRHFMLAIGGLAISPSGWPRPSTAAAAPWSLLAQQLAPADGELLLPGSASYKERQGMVNLRVDSAPAGIVVCRTALGVQQSVGWARQHRVALHVRSGGHAYEAISTGAGLLLDLSPLKAIRLDEQAGVVHLGPGARLGAVTEALAEHGYALPVGTCPSVGIAGLTLGGGYGMLSRRWGLSCDQLVGLDLITADGQCIRVSESEHPELWWASRGGGGGHFGVVTQLSMRVRPLREVWLFTIKWPNTALSTALGAWQAWAPSADDGFSSQFTVSAAAEQGIASIECLGVYAPSHPDSLPSATQLTQQLQLLSQTGPVELSLVRLSYLEAARRIGAEDPQQVYFKAKSLYANAPLSAEGLAALEHGLRTLHAGKVSAVFNAGGGAIARLPAQNSAYVHRQALFTVQVYGAWTQPEDSSAMLQSVRQLYQQLQPYGSGGAYSNHADLDLQDWGHAYYGDNFARLQQIKAAYDPQGIFSQRPQAIPSQRKKSL